MADEQDQIEDDNSFPNEDIEIKISEVAEEVLKTKHRIDESDLTSGP